jgi:hypothetical protein
MAQWTITVDPETDSAVRRHLETVGASGADLSAFVTEAVKRFLFWQAVDAIRAHNAGVDPAEIEAAVDAAVDEVRRERK